MQLQRPIILLLIHPVPLIFDNLLVAESRQVLILRVVDVFGGVDDEGFLFGGDAVFQVLVIFEDGARVRLYHLDIRVLDVVLSSRL